MDSNVQKLIRDGDQLFSQRTTLMQLWQSGAENFYPERADFTVNRIIGQDFADYLTTSFPIIARRDLGNSISGMLRPANKQWFKISIDGEEKLDVAGKQWLERATLRQRSVMYDRKTQFIRATKEADHDFVCFGQAVLQKTLNSQANGLLYKTHHLRDVAWSENYDGVTSTPHRKWKPTILEMSQAFKGNISPKLTQRLKDKPYDRIECRHIVVPNDGICYEAKKKWKQPFISIVIDVENDFMLEEIGSWDQQYIIPRWQTVSGSQYAYSPALVAALPDARLIQSMTLALLEAGEKAASPPMVAVQEAIKGGAELYAGGVTWVDADYDERLGEVLRPITQNLNGLPIGLEMQKDIREQITKAFFLDKITLPMMSGERTAYEMGIRVSEYIRNALPLFEPLEQDYNAALCDMTFNDCLRRGVFGSTDDMPDSLSGKEVMFKFDSPLTDAIGTEKGQKFLENQQFLAQAAAVDPSATFLIDVKEALKDVFVGVGTPAAWLRDDKAVQDMIDQQHQKEQAQQMIDGLQGAAKGAASLGDAANQFSQAGVTQRNPQPSPA